MKSKEHRISKIFLMITSILMVIVLSFTGVGCGDKNGALYDQYPNPNPGRYTQNTTKSIKVPNGGTLTSFVQRQSQGSLAGETLSVDYQVKALYDGTSKVKEIRSTWVIKAQFRRTTSSSTNASISAGKDSVSFSIGESSSSEYKDQSLTKYYVSTNGIKQVVYASNYLLYPYKQLNSQTLQNTATLIIEGYAGPTTVMWAA